MSMYKMFKYESFNLPLCRMQQIDLERREKKFDNADKMYTKLMKQIPTKHEKYKNMKTWIAMKYARFQFKICNDVDKVPVHILCRLQKIFLCKQCCGAASFLCGSGVKILMRLRLRLLPFYLASQPVKKLT
jgi:hypothetical protein